MTRSSTHTAISPTHPASVMESRLMRWVYRTVPLLTSLAVAAASFALSFVALREVAIKTSAVSPALAWLVPIVIDGGILCASAVIWAQASLGQQRSYFPMTVVAVLVIISVIVNAAHAGPTPLAKIIASLPPLVLLATLELVAITTRSGNSTPAAQTPTVGTGPTASTHFAATEAVVTPANQPARKAPAAGSAAGKSGSRNGARATTGARTAPARTGSRTAASAGTSQQVNGADPAAELDRILLAELEHELDTIDDTMDITAGTNERRNGRVRAVPPESWTTGTGS